MTVNSASLPVVSIVTIAFNSASTIRDTLDSVAKQKYPCIEHIIIDGASTDNTVLIASEFPHISKIVSEPDDGLYDAMNKGIHHATGDIVGILNSDDILTDEDVISLVVNTMLAENTECLYGDLVFVNRQDINSIYRYWKSGPFVRNKFLWGWMPPHPTFFIKRRQYQQHGQFKTQLVFSADYELMLRFLYNLQIPVSYLPKVMVKMRMGGVSNASYKNRLRANKEDRMAWKLNGSKPYFFTTWLKPISKISQFFGRKKATV